ncbi:LacI family transcriptional regulator [Actinotalea sp. M2MS4P-6]|uniref:LacI family DNA-binding transcriptional regulator n=1 Tax=Actinotalea sp. M2MS4P-6 TaxID=2983762 RepID=UPI0021E403EE|nr:LacI family DNA-binding transcriptional regulator [Actinotalea sp. M2MS4P-6]MCV2395640.1 LacI family transcriptional regulator [Actinotalea sp. M2MS4P-6]
MAATVKDVARRAGVSPRTVSNVVTGTTRVADATRARVEQAIAELGYRPNAAARNLRRGRTGMIALVVPELDQPYFAELARATIAAAERHDYRVMLEQTDAAESAERRVFAADQDSTLFDGIIFSAVEIGLSDVRSISQARPVVLLGERSFESAFDHVAIDNVAAARTAVQHLIDLGRTRIAAIGAQDDHDTARLRTLGYTTALRDAGQAVDPALIESTRRFHRADGAEAMARLLDQGEPPDAVFCYSDVLALGAMHTLHTRGLRIPEDVAVVGIDDIEDGRFSHPPLTTISPDKEYIARQAVDRLIARIGDRELAAVDLVAPSELVVRQSTSGTP